MGTVTEVTPEFQHGCSGSRSPQSLLRGLAPHGYRGRSVSRSSAALRHRHPTHTPSRGPARRIPAVAALTAATPPLDVRRDALLLRQRGTPHTAPHRIIGRVREDQVEGST